MKRSIPLVMMSLTSFNGLTDSATREKATFAGGCFWCMEAPFDGVNGVISTVSGYTGGQTNVPTYEQVSSGVTGHTEAVQVTYDPSRVHYKDLLNIFWKNIDPTVKDKQFCDNGSQYRSGIFVHSEEQKQLAELSKERLRTLLFKGQDIHTEIKVASIFYVAEGYHQDYYHKNPYRYKFYRYNCGRDQRLNELWGEISEPIL